MGPRCESGRRARQRSSGVCARAADEIVIGGAGRVGVQKHPAAVADGGGGRRLAGTGDGGGRGTGRGRERPQQGGVVGARSGQGIPRPGELERRAIVGLHARIARPAVRASRPARRTSTGRGTARARRRAARSAATPGRCQRPATFDSCGSSGSVDPTSRTSPSPTSHNVPSGNTDRKVATIDLQVVGADVVGVGPLAEHAARLEAIAGGLEELAGEERGDASHPRVRRLGNDDVIALAGQQEVGPAVADDDARAWVERAPDDCPRRSTAPPPRPRAKSRAHRRCAIGWVSAEPSVTPLPRPRMATRFGSGWSSSGTCASSRCVSMSPAFDASTLPSMASESRSAGLPDRDGAGRALAVVQQLAGGEPGAQIGRAQDRRVLVAAAREQQPVPVREHGRRDEHGHRDRGRDQATASARPSRDEHERRRRARRRPATSESCLAAPATESTRSPRPARRRWRPPCSRRR